LTLQKPPSPQCLMTTNRNLIGTKSLSEFVTDTSGSLCVHPRSYAPMNENWVEGLGFRVQDLGFRRFVYIHDAVHP